MVARVKITTTVGPDGSIRLLERDVSAAGIQAGDHVEVEVVRDAKPERAAPSAESLQSEPPRFLTAEEQNALTFDEWTAYGRSLFDFRGLTYEEVRRQSQDAAADEYWEKFLRGEE